MLPLAILSLAFNHQSSAGQLDYILEGGDPEQPHRTCDSWFPPLQRELS